MVWSSTLRRSSLALVGATLAIMTSACGDKVEVKEAANDALREIVWQKDGLATKFGDDLTVTRIVVSRTTPRVFAQTSGGSGDSRDRYSVEFWGRHDNSTRGDSRVDQAKSAERYGSIGNLLSDRDGNLYADGMEPGTVIDNPALQAVSGENYRGIDHWTIAANTALVAKFNWLEMVQNTVVGGNTSVDAIDLGEVFQIGNKDGEKHKRLTELATNTFFSFSGDYDSSSNDSIYSVNTNYNTYKGKVACVITPFDDATAGNQGAATTVTLATAQLNLGRNLIEDDGLIASTASAGASGTQTLIVSWDVSYHLAGFNWRTGKINWYKTTSAPAWQNRELPNVDAGVAVASPSGLEDAIRECNNAAGPNDEWSLVSRDTLGSGADFNAAPVSHCAGLKADASKANWPLNTFNATIATPPYDCTASFAPLITGATKIAVQGNWQVVGTGMVHTGRVTSGDPGATTGDLIDTETTDIVETAL